MLLATGLGLLFYSLYQFFAPNKPKQDAQDAVLWVSNTHGIKIDPTGKRTTFKRPRRAAIVKSVGVVLVGGMVMIGITWVDAATVKTETRSLPITPCVVELDGARYLWAPTFLQVERDEQGEFRFTTTTHKALDALTSAESFVGEVPECQPRGVITDFFYRVWPPLIRPIRDIF